MKKQKQSATVSESRPAVAENDLALLVYATSQEELSLVNKNVAPALLRSRPEAALIVYSDLSLKEDDAALKEISAKGKLRMVTSSEEFSTALSDLKCSWLTVVDANEDFDPAKSVSCYSQNRKLFNAAAVNKGVYNKASGNLNLSFGQKLKKSIFNFFAQLLLPAQAKDYSHRYFFYPKEAAVEIFSPSCKGPLAWISQAAYAGYGVEPFTLNAKLHHEPLISYSKIFSLFFTTRFRWFFSLPVQQLRGKATGSKNAIWRLAFASLMLFALIAMPVLSFDFGISWDAKRHNQYGYQMLSYYTSLGQDTACLSPGSTIHEFRFYGEHFNVIAAFFNTYVKVFEEYEMRHFLNALYGFLAMLFAALSAKEIGSWRGGTLGFLFIFLSPVFFAHSMNNPTDIPFATGCSIALYYLLKLIRNLPAPKASHIFMCGLGIGIAIGARVGGIVWFAYTGMFAGIHWLIYLKGNGWKNATRMIWPYAKVVLSVIVVGHLIGISLWPFGHQHPLTNWYVALKRSTDATFFTFNHELFEGVRMYMAEVPWYYLPKFIIINNPLFVIAGVCILLLASFVLRKVFSRAWLLGIVGFVFLFPIVYAEYQSMYYYNGWRHYLFNYPPLIVLSACGWEGLIRFLSIKQWRMPVWITAAILGVLLVLPAWWMIKNHPNECVYFNELTGGLPGAYGNYETDYYSNSCRAAAEWLAQQEPSRKVVVAINNEPLTASYYTNKVNPNIEFVWVREYEEQKPFWDYQILTSRTYSKNELRNGYFPPKGTVHAVEAEGVPLAVVVKRENYFMPLGYQAVNAKNLDSCLYYFEQAVKADDKGEEQHRMYAFCLMLANRFPEAEKEFDRAIEIFPENFTAWSNKALMYFNLKEYQKCIQACQKAYTYKVNVAEPYYYAGLSYLNLNDYNSAIKVLEKSLKYNTSVKELYFYLGMAYNAVGSHKKAITNFEFALTIDVKYAGAWQAMGEAYSKLGQAEAAQQCMQKYRELGGQ